MNLLEHYVKEVHSVSDYTAEWTKEFPNEYFVEVDLTYDCYGRTERKTHIWNIDKWGQIKQRGYFMA